MNYRKDRYSIASCSKFLILLSLQHELKTLEWDILNPDRLINLEINNKRRTSIILSRD